MKTKYECIPCLANQTIKLGKKLTNDEVLQKDLIGKGLKIIGEQAFQEAPPYITAQVYAYSKEKTGIEDPFEEEKLLHNKIAASLVEALDLKELVEKSKWPFDKAVRLSIAGNIIDFSVGYAIDEDLVAQSIEKSFNTSIFGESLKDLESAIEKANKILYLADNAGEIVFDQLLVNLLPKEKVTYVVKGKPIVNDATMKDVEFTKMDELVKVVDTGSGIQGTYLSDCKDDFLKLFDEADLIISKGQANFETLSHLSDKNIFFLLRAKCQCIADEIGCKKGEFVLVKPK